MGSKRGTPLLVESEFSVGELAAQRSLPVSLAVLRVFVCRLEGKGGVVINT